MGGFLIFVMATFALFIIGMATWWIWSKISVSIERTEESFDIEKETYKKIKKKIKEEKT